MELAIAKNDFRITTEILLCALRNSECGKEMVELLLTHSNPAITLEVITIAAKREDNGSAILEYLLHHSVEKVRMIDYIFAANKANIMDGEMP